MTCLTDAASTQGVCSSSLWASRPKRRCRTASSESHCWWLAPYSFHHWSMICAGVMGLLSPCGRHVEARSPEACAHGRIGKALDQETPHGSDGLLKRIPWLGHRLEGDRGRSSQARGVPGGPTTADAPWAWARRKAGRSV